MLLKNKGFVIPKHQLNEVQLKQIKSDLTCVPRSATKTIVQPQPVKYYLESPGFLCVPRHYAREKLTSHDMDCNKMGRVERMRPEVSFNGTLNKKTSQDEAVEACLHDLQHCGGALLSLPTGYGKTACALYIAAQLGMKTIVLVHTAVLMDQWIERIRHFLPEANIGVIQGSTVDVEGKDITIAMLQTVVKRQYPFEVFESFASVIIDEAHHIAAVNFSKSMFMLSRPYMLGLSATPKRKDGLTRALHWFIGPMSFKLERRDTRVSVQSITFTHPLYDESMPSDKMGNICMPRVINHLADLHVRNELLIELVCKELADGCRSLLMLTDRRAHAKLLSEMLTALNISNGVFLGGMTKKELALSADQEVIIATYSIASEGLDISKLQTLLMCTPRSDVVQASGRVMRTAGKYLGGRPPRLIDVEDRWGALIAQARKRAAFYRKSNFNITVTNSGEQKADDMEIDNDEFMIKF